MEKEYKTLKEFYPYYLTEHSNTTCRTLHFAGTTLVFILLFIAAFIVGYGFAWVGHFFFEKNKPATFKYPLYSFVCDFLMYFDLLLGKIPFNSNSKA